MTIRLFSFLFLIVVIFSRLTSVQAQNIPILFISDRDGNREIYSMNEDGTNVIRLTNNPDEDSEPVWSPDGRQIAFTSKREGDFAIYVMNADGNNVRRVTTDAMSRTATSPAWSPDGRTLAFVSNTIIQSVNVDGTDLRRLTQADGEAYDPAWSPDGRQIAYALFQIDSSKIFVMNVDGSQSQQLSREERATSESPAWSPDGTQIAFTAIRGSNGGDILILNITNGQTRPLTGGGNTFPSSPAWSPDGQTIVYAQGEYRQPYSIFSIAADGNGVRRLTDGSSDGVYPAWASPALISPRSGGGGSSAGIVAVPVTNGIISTPRLNVRSQPDPETYIVARLSLNDTVGVIGRNSNSTWVMVDMFGRVGWVNGEYISVATGVSSLPIVDGNSTLPGASSTFTFSCFGARGPSFALNSRFTVPFGDGPTLVRELPSSRVVVESVPEGSGGTVIAGPVCSAAAENRVLTYWYVRTDAGTYGYMSEGFTSSPVAWMLPG